MDANNIRPITPFQLYLGCLSLISINNNSNNSNVNANKTLEQQLQGFAPLCDDVLRSLTTHIVSLLERPPLHALSLDGALNDLCQACGDGGGGGSCEVSNQVLLLLCSIDSLDVLYNLVESMFSVLPPLGSDDHAAASILAPSSPISLFLRSIRISFLHLDFSNISSLYTHTTSFLLASVQFRKKRHLLCSNRLNKISTEISNIQTSCPGADQTAIANLLAEKNRLQKELEFCEANLQENVGKPNVLEAYGLQEWVEREAEIIGKSMHVISEDELASRISHLKSLAPDSPHVHWLDHLLHLTRREYDEAIDAAHRFFDYFVGPTHQRTLGTECSVLQYAPYILIVIAATQHYFGFLEEARDTLVEAIALAQETKDAQGIQFALSWWASLLESEGRALSADSHFVTHSSRVRTLDSPVTTTAASTPSQLGVSVTVADSAREIGWVRESMLFRDNSSMFWPKDVFNTLSSPQHQHTPSSNNASYHASSSIACVVQACVWHSAGHVVAASRTLQTWIQKTLEHSITTNPATARRQSQHQNQQVEQEPVVGRGDMVPAVSTLALMVVRGHVTSLSGHAYPFELLESVRCVRGPHSDWWVETVWVCLFENALLRQRLDQAQSYLTQLSKPCQMTDHVGQSLNTDAELRVRQMHVRLRIRQRRFDEAISEAIAAAAWCDQQKRQEHHVMFLLHVVEAHRMAGSGPTAVVNILRALDLAKKHCLLGLEVQGELEASELAAVLDISSRTQQGKNNDSRSKMIETRDFDAIINHVIVMGDQNLYGLCHLTFGKLLLLEASSEQSATLTRASKFLFQAFQTFLQLTDLGRAETCAVFLALAFQKQKNIGEQNRWSRIALQLAQQQQQQQQQHATSPQSPIAIQTNNHHHRDNSCNNGSTMTHPEIIVRIGNKNCLDFVIASEREVHLWCQNLLKACCYL